MFAVRLKELRLEKKLTQKDLAEKLNMQNTAISKYELNERKPDTETLLKIAKYFNVSTDYLLGSSDMRNPYIDEMDDVNQLEQEFEELKDKMKNISPSKRKKILKMIELFEEDEED